MGVCYGTPDFATPSFTGSLKSNMKLTISSSSSEGCGLAWGGEIPKILPLPNLTVFTLAEIQKATRYFDRDSMLGEGGYGLVYRGRIGTGELVAVKKLRKSAMQGLREWQSEVNFLGRIDHPNIVKLLGYCLEDKEEPLLVYELAQKGSLDNHLFGRGAVAHPLTWEARVKIAIGVAKGLAFLHSSEMNIIYRDFKTFNILLDATYTARLSDFGLARPGPPEGESHIKTRVIGTHGYAAPEYIATGCLYIASDVYSYGVVLLEMLTGLRAIDKHRPKGKHNLVEWSKAYMHSRRKIINVVDPNLKGEYPITAAMQMAELALECLEPSPKMRPPMSNVVERLEEIAASKTMTANALSISGYLARGAPHPVLIHITNSDAIWAPMG